MPYVTINSIENGTYEAKNGKIHSGTWVYGIKEGFEDNPDEEYSKFLFDWDAKRNSMFEPFGAGDRVNIKNEKKGKFWEIVSVTSLDGGGSGTVATPSPSSASTPTAPQTQSSVVKGSVFNHVREADEIIKGEALGHAVAFTTGIKDVFPKKVTPDILKEFALGLAGEMVDNIKGVEKIDTQTEVDTSGLNTDAPSSSEPDDDVPFEDA